MKKIILLLIIHTFFINYIYASDVAENTKAEFSQKIDDTKSITNQVKTEGKYYKDTIKQKYNTTYEKFRAWYNTNNKNIMYLPYLEVKIFDFFAGVIVVVSIITVAVKFLTKKR